MKKISDKQQRILEYIKEYSLEHGYPPSVREIGAEMGLRSPSTVHAHLKKLQEAGWLEETIAAEGDRRRIVFLHIPPGTSTWHGDLHIRETLLPVLEKTSVGLMLSGHTHTYSLHKAGELAPFPILVNDNRSCVSVTVDGDTITAVISGNTGKSHTFRFPE